MWGRSSSPPPPTSADANGAWILMPAGSSPRHASRKFRSAAPPPRERGANRTATTSERAAPFRYKSPTRAQKSPHAKTDPEKTAAARGASTPAAPTRRGRRRATRRARPPPRRSGRRASCHRYQPDGVHLAGGAVREEVKRDLDVPRPDARPDGRRRRRDAFQRGRERLRAAVGAGPRRDRRERTARCQGLVERGPLHQTMLAACARNVHNWSSYLSL